MVSLGLRPNAIRDDVECVTIGVTTDVCAQCLATQQPCTKYNCKCFGFRLAGCRHVEQVNALDARTETIMLRGWPLELQVSHQLGNWCLNIC
jgi:hypothetical protein